MDRTAKAENVRRSCHRPSQVSTQPNIHGSNAVVSRNRTTASIGPLRATPPRRRVDELWSEAGIICPDLTQRDFAETGPHVDDLHRFWKGELFEPQVLEFPAADAGEPTELTMVRVLSVVLAGSRLAVAELLTFDGKREGSENVYRQRDRRIAKIEEIGLKDDAIASFAERVSLKSGANGVMTLTEN